jgi:hypothetical protein
MDPDNPNVTDPNEPDIPAYSEAIEAIEEF